jgi:glycosyltransferase involved in cell wall biosynthesis
MFVAAASDPIPYEAPWNADFAARLGALTKRSRHIAYFYEEPDTSTFRYRIFNMVKALEAQSGGETSASWFINRDLPQMNRFIDRADALVICRTRYSPGLDRLIARARARGIPVVFDIDDFVFDPAHIRLVMETLDQDASPEAALDVWFAMASRLGATLRLCDRAIVTNDFLADRIRDFVPEISVGIIPNYLSYEQQRVSSELYYAKRASRFLSDDRIHLGYFSGTPTHNRDFAIIAPALARLFDRDPRLILRVVGFLDQCELLTRYPDRIEIYPLQDFLNLQRLIAEVEINVAPLQNNLFTNCKSELKYFEAAITGTITIASPTFTFRRAISHGESSFLASAYEWERVLLEALALVDDRKRYAEMAKLGFAAAEAGYAWNKFGHLIERVVFQDNVRSLAPPTEAALSSMVVDPGTAKSPA